MKYKCELLAEQKSLEGVIKLQHLILDAVGLCLVKDSKGEHWMGQLLGEKETADLLHPVQQLLAATLGDGEWDPCYPSDDEETRIVTYTDVFVNNLALKRKLPEGYGGLKVECAYSHNEGAHNLKLYGLGAIPGYDASKVKKANRISYSIASAW